MLVSIVADWHAGGARCCSRNSFAVESELPSQAGNSNESEDVGTLVAGSPVARVMLRSLGIVLRMSYPAKPERLTNLRT